MAAKVILEVTRGQLRGKCYEYTEQERVFLGRQEDCGIVFPEKTVSRYHCMLSICPPRVMLQDFGSLNGTFLNEENIGQRERSQSCDEARGLEHPEHELRDGDRLRLGKSCELVCRVQAALRCRDCGRTLSPEEEARVERETAEPLCDTCIARIRAEEERAERERQEEEDRRRREAEQQAKAASEATAGRKTCKGCGKSFLPKAADNELCPDCLNDRAQLLDGILAAIAGRDAARAKEAVVASQAAGPKDYEKLSLLGKGGMGEVWKVREADSGRILAMKTMLPEAAAAGESHRKRFLREASVAKQLNHRNVVKTYEAGSLEDSLYIVMELCEGGSVEDRIKRSGGKLPLDYATYIMLQVLSGLDYVHNLNLTVPGKNGLFGGTEEEKTTGIVHRDFKPGNIFLSDTGNHPVAKVADFGMAKAFAAAGMQLTQTGQSMGTPPFMPRAQALDFKYAKPEVDVWAAAASYYYMLTGKFPRNFRVGKNPWQTIVTEPVVPIRQRDSAIPAAMAEVIDRALGEEPRIGYSTAAEFRRDLAAALPAFLRNYCKEILI